MSVYPIKNCLTKSLGVYSGYCWKQSIIQAQQINTDARSKDTLDITSDMQGLVWGEPELAHEYDIDVENTEQEVGSMHCVHLVD